MSCNTNISSSGRIDGLPKSRAGFKPPVPFAMSLIQRYAIYDYLNFGDGHYHAIAFDCFCTFGFAGAGGSRLTRIGLSMLVLLQIQVRLSGKPKRLEPFQAMVKMP
jgi:hypothetical protein